MNEYIQIEFPAATSEQKELLIAQLLAVGFEGFEETESGLKAFIQQKNYDEESVKEVADADKLDFYRSIIEETNWNELWESNFSPVRVGDFVAIRAEFHPTEKGVQHEIVITPKMSFGTGHHATTLMMIEQMKEIDFADKSVLDFGTGTAVLAILAEKLGAKKVLAIDNDQWSIDNAGENIARNSCHAIELKKDDTPDSDELYDIILANVNKNVIIENFHLFAKQVVKNGVLLLSGLLPEDSDVIFHICTEYSLQLTQTSVRDNWLCLRISC